MGQGNNGKVTGSLLTSQNTTKPMLTVEMSSCCSLTSECCVMPFQAFERKKKSTEGDVDASICWMNKIDPFNGRYLQSKVKYNSQTAFAHVIFSIVIEPVNIKKYCSTFPPKMPTSLSNKNFALYCI